MTETPAPRDSEERRSGRLGRRIALAIWALCLAYMTVVGFNSVIRQVFFAPLPAAVRALSPAECPSEIESLRAAIFEHSGEHVRSAGQTPIDPWLTAWDLRAQAASARCDGDAFASLMRLRFRIETTLRRFDHEEARLSGRVLELNEPSAASDTSTP